MREGKGIFKTSEGKVYEGGWSQNKIHGRGRERFASGECFLVYYKNGCRIEALASKPVTKGDPSIKEMSPEFMNSSIKGQSFATSKSRKKLEKKSSSGKIKKEKDCVIF